MTAGNVRNEAPSLITPLHTLRRGSDDRCRRASEATRRLNAPGKPTARRSRPDELAAGVRALDHLGGRHLAGRSRRCRAGASKARRKFADLLGRRHRRPRRRRRQARILLFHGQSGAGKTHLIRALRTAAHREGKAYFGYAQMTPDVANYADYYLRRLVNSLEKPYDPDRGGESALPRLTNRLVEDAEVVSTKRSRRAARGHARRGRRWPASCCARRRDRRRAEVRRRGARHQYRARAALSAAPRSAHRSARAPVSARPPADRCSPHEAVAALDPNTGEGRAFEIIEASAS